ncbi:helix-turn-helix domain-containing protein [Mesorhizobium sp. ISC11]|uniref:helix-turn-helix domain-containing protein n=1 Tax=Mesorhizobium sp. ISC11 TaxID=3076428 RepID=UPI003FA58B8B
MGGTQLPDAVARRSHDQVVRPVRALLRAPLRQGHGHEGDRLHPCAQARAGQAALLETGELPVEAVANEVGYEDASFFGRLFRRQVGVTPAQYRIRFGALRRALSRD